MVIMKHLLPALMLLPLASVEAAVADRGRARAIQWAPCQLDLGYIQNSIKVQINCAKLDVPLDYTNPNCQESLPLQLIKVNATKAPFKGSVIFNPGGPGDSGIEDLAITSPLYNSVLGGHYDLVSFDPRGTGKTIPFDCHIWDNASMPTGLSTREVTPKENMTDLLLRKDWHDSTEIADSCYQTQNQTGRFLGTAFVARDIMRIVDALHEDGMLRYWGTSYGTMLGATIASMFPDRIDRMYLDSVVNPLDYMSGYGLTNTADSDQALMGFFEECIRSGPSYCSIANFSGPSTTPQHLLTALDAVFQDLIDKPQYLPAGASTFAWNKIPPLSLYENIKSQVFENLYSPVGWSSLADSLLETLAFNFSQYDHVYNLPVVRYNDGVQAFWGIECSDSAFRAKSPEDMLWLVNEQQNVSGFSDIAQSDLWPCYQWKMSAAERYTGNFSVKTSFPILLTNGHYDPITPYASAVNVSKGFEGSVLLTHGGHGHTWYSDPSLCTARAIKAYFNNGTLPAPGTYCAPDSPAFEIDIQSLLSGNYSDRRRSDLGNEISEEDIDMLQAIYKLAYHSWERVQRYGGRL